MKQPTVKLRKKAARRVSRGASANVLIREALEAPKPKVRVITDVKLIAISFDGRPHVVGQ